MNREKAHGFLPLFYRMETAYGICNLSVVPGRAEASDKSEMITQLLFGEHFTILRESGSWVYIRCAFDNYECWIDSKQYQVISAETFSDLEQHEAAVSMELISAVEDSLQGQYFPIVAGSSLPFFDGKTCNLEGYEYQFEGLSTLEPTSNDKAEQLLQFAWMYRNSPYLWGGRSPMGIDCSGFVQVAYKSIGMKLPRDANQQAECGEVLGFMSETQPGDLVFFDNAEGRIIHVGILVDQHQVLHASGKVRLDAIDHQGIFNRETGEYTHNLRLIKRVG